MKVLRIERTFVTLLIISFIIKFLFFLFGIKNIKINFPLFTFEGWRDYFYHYVPTVQAFKNGYLPYRDFYHAYPPLFLYFLTLFSFIPYFWSIALPIVIFDALTIVPIYFISKYFFDNDKAFLASIIFALAPINLFYIDFLWLNPSLTTFFLLISIYFFIKERYDISAIIFAISIGFKQTSLLVLPIFLLFLLKKKSLKYALKYFIIVLFICFLFSIPYIFLEPKLYLFSIFRIPFNIEELPKNYFQLGISTEPLEYDTINTATLKWYELKMMKYVPLNAPINFFLPIFIFILPENFLNLYSSIDYLMKILFFIAYILFLYKIHKKNQFQNIFLIKNVLYSLLIFFIFNPIYKYYVAGITPLLILLNKKKKNFIIFEIFNITLLLIPRIFTSYILIFLFLLLLKF